jgi:hypothetical protein
VAGRAPNQAGGEENLRRPPAFFHGVIAKDNGKIGCAGSRVEMEVRKKNTD